MTAAILNIDPLSEFGLREVPHPVTATAGTLVFTITHQKTGKRERITKDFTRSRELPPRLTLAKTSPHPGDDTLTVLHCAPPHRAAKRIVVDPTSCSPDPSTWRYDVEDYDCGVVYVALLEIELSNIYELYYWLCRLSQDPGDLLIRGQPLPHVMPPLLRRSDRDREHPTFRDRPGGKKWIMVDVDTSIVGDFDLIGDPESAVREVLSHLPSFLKRATCIWQLSNTAWLKGVRVHLFFWLDRFVTKEELTAVFADYPVDCSVFRTVQPNFIADPIFVGAADPLPSRWGLLRGGAR